MKHVSKSRWPPDALLLVCPAALREKRSNVVAQLKQLQSETEPIVKMFEDPETTRQMQSTRYTRPRPLPSCMMGSRTC